MNRAKELIKWYLGHFPNGGFLNLVLEDGNYDTLHIVHCLLNWRYYAKAEEQKFIEENKDKVVEMCTLILNLKDRNRWKLWKYALMQMGE